MQKSVSVFKAITLDEVRAFVSIDKITKEKMSFEEKWNVYSPEIVEIINEYVASGKYPYNRDIEKLVNVRIFPDIADEVDGAHQSKFFATIVYNSQSYRHAALREKEMRQLLDAGWMPITEEACRARAAAKEKVIVRREVDGMLGTSIKEEVYKLLVDAKGDCFFMNPKARTKGFLWHRFADDLFKEVTNSGSLTLFAQEVRQ